MIASLPGCTKHLKHFKAAVRRHKWGIATIFDSGNIVGSKSTSVACARWMANYVIATLQANGFPTARVCNFQVRNIVAKISFGWCLKLQDVSDMLPLQSSYSPELFPSVQIRDDGLVMPDGVKLGRVTISAFRSGTLNITGCPSEIYIKHIVQFYWKHIFSKCIDVSCSTVKSDVYRDILDQYECEHRLQIFADAVCGQPRRKISRSI